jgi:dTDP-4-dehydrorhamnose reductase
VDNPRPSSAYGASKLKGEWGIRGAGLNYFILRTCGLYGLHGVGGKGGNFVETMLRVAGQGKPLRVVNDQRCTPSSTQDVARATLQLLETKQYGLYHLTNSGDCSWYEFAAEIFRLSGLSPSLTAIPTVDYPTPAKRPEYSVLDLSQLTSVGVARPRPWQEALAEYLSKRRTG